MVIVQHILPALRLEITRQLVEIHGIRKGDAARKMGVTAAAVSQYLTGARGTSASTIINNSETMMSLLEEISEDIATGKSSLDILLLKLCSVCVVARNEGLICDLHKEAVPGLSEVRGCSCSLNLSPRIK